MIYVTSDLHGYPLHRFLDLLRQAGFGERDFLFVLGDVTDRNGDGGIAMLQWMMVQPNVELILGNHEAMLLSCAFLFEEITDASLERLEAGQLDRLSAWMCNGAEPTLEALRRLRREDPETVEDILEYLREAPLYETVDTQGRDFLLVHAGLGNFAPNRPLSDYAADELLWHRPDADEQYFDDVMTVLGHTPTGHYGTRGKAFQTRTWIDIDTGAAGGGAPMILRLEDMRAFYQEN